MSSMPMLRTSINASCAYGRSSMFDATGAPLPLAAPAPAPSGFMTRAEVSRALACCIMPPCCCCLASAHRRTPAPATPPTNQPNCPPTNAAQLARNAGRAALAGGLLCLELAVMLVAVTFNLGLLISLVLGAALGALAFGAFHPLGGGGQAPCLRVLLPLCCAVQL